MTDRPWGMTLGALGMRGLTGELVLTADGKHYRVAFEQGAVVAAYSPMVADAAVRVALTANLITSSQVSELTRRLAAAPDRDEVDVIAELCRLQPEHTQRLRRRLVAQRAARTFSADQGQFVVDDQISLRVVAGSALDVRAIIFLGARNNLSEQRLAAELAQLGVWFKLKPEAVDDLAQYGFTEEEKPVLQMLLEGANVGDVEATHAEVGVRTVRAVVYSLASCGACEASLAPKPSPVPVAARTTSSSVAGPMPSRTTSPPGQAPIPPRTTSSSVGGPMPARTASTSVQPRAGSPTVPPQTVMRTGAPTVPPPVQNTSPARTASSSSPPQTSSPGAGSSTGNHKTAPLGSRSPVANGDGRPSSPGQPPLDDASQSRGPRSITESTGVPRATNHAGSSGTWQSGSSSTRLPRASDRSPSSGVARPHDRSPSGGVPQPMERTSSSSIPRPSGVHPVARAHSPTARPLSQTGSPLMSRTRTESTGASGLRPPAGTRSGSGTIPPTQPARRANVPRRPKQSTAATLEIEALLQKKIPMLDQGVDYFTLFGLHVGASPEEVRSTYFMLARKLHPDRLAAIGVDDDDRQAQRLMACINEGFAVLNDPVRREEYLSVLGRGGEAAVRAEEQKADELAMRVMRAEEAFRQGEMALRREQLQQAIQQFSVAVDLQPNEPEYQALLAWAKFAAAADKQSVATQTRKALIRAAEANDNSPTARFYLGRVERMLGREKEALANFYEVLRIKPTHSEASSEARILEQRLKARR